MQEYGEWQGGDAVQPQRGITPAWKVYDGWMAFATGAGAELVTFDKALFDFARKRGHAAVIPQ
ncbi:MAG: hypothetical protein ABSA94_18305 [Acidobacteriaceae bacterium]|jgi:predicted nucleic acid-binding protein